MLIESLEPRRLLTGVSTLTPLPLATAPSENAALSVSQVQKILAQAISQSLNRGKAAEVAVVVDREGTVLGSLASPGAVSLGATSQGIITALATVRAHTAAFFQSDGEAFSTRTARFIIQNHFPPGINSTAGGPLYGVEFSDLINTDILLASQTPGVSGDPGGIPLYMKSRTTGKYVAVGGIGVAGDFHDVSATKELVPVGQLAAYNANPKGIVYGGREEADFDEAVAQAGARGFAAPPSIRANNIYVGGLQFPFVAEAAASGRPNLLFGTLTGMGAAASATFTAGTPEQQNATIGGVTGLIRDRANVEMSNVAGVPVSALGAAAITAATESGNTVTLTVASTAGFATSQQVIVGGVTPTGYNGNFTITVASPTTFTYTDLTPGLVTATAFGNIAPGVNAAPPAITAATETGSTVTLTLASTAGFATGQEIVVTGVTPAGYNGTFAVTVVDPTTLTYTATSSGLATATAFGTAFPAIPVTDPQNSEAFIPGDPSPNDSTDFLSVQDVQSVIGQAVDQASITRAGIRKPNGVNAEVHVVVVDVQGNVLGAFRMNDGTNFSYDVAVQKARTAAFFSDDTHAYSARAIGFMSQKFFPAGIQNAQVGPLFKLQNDLDEGFAPTSTNPLGLVTLQPTTTPFAGIANGITIFPGGFPLYKNGHLVGAVGVSGDGVDQDDLIAFSGAHQFEPPVNIRSDALGGANAASFLMGKVASIPSLGFNLTANGFNMAAANQLMQQGLVKENVRLPYAKFPRNPLTFH